MQQLPFVSWPLATELKIAVLVVAIFVSPREGVQDASGSIEVVQVLANKNIMLANKNINVIV